MYFGWSPLAERRTIIEARYEHLSGHPEGMLLWAREGRL